MRAAWKLIMYSSLGIGWIATYYHHPAGHIFAIITATMICMSCVAELIAEIRGKNEHCDMASFDHGRISKQPIDY